MNLEACAQLARGPESRTWYRAIEAIHWETALQSSHTGIASGRYNLGARDPRPYEVLYLAEDHQVALYEVRALSGDPFPEGNGAVFPNPAMVWTILNVRVTLTQVADLTKTASQEPLGTTAQELTGDWAGYQRRNPHSSVPEPTGIAPTQALGRALYGLAGLEGFRAVSARLPSRMLLVVFPEKLRPGSLLEFSDGRGNTHRIEPRPRSSRRSRR